MTSKQRLQTATDEAMRSAQDRGHAVPPSKPVLSNSNPWIENEPNCECNQYRNSGENQCVLNQRTDGDDKSFSTMYLKNLTMVLSYIPEMVEHKVQRWLRKTGLRCYGNLK